MTRKTPGLAPPAPKFRTTPAGGCPTPVKFNVHRPTIKADLQWNRVSSLKPFGSEAEILALGHRDPMPFVNTSTHLKNGLKFHKPENFKKWYIIVFNSLTN
ncbi:hypothetical protein AVEN_30230-1 [Araneus ventricosus]|uniref:Uncharacterized protein n=1 Tax=Araneus ventricosus TaxID=182803 RepID=A0A4Y2PB60_ARAVE|nr:hypothetical protein AVEN_30230-1 [Araneus ventricosus]